jgi:hypothetical protein
MFQLCSAFHPIGLSHLTLTKGMISAKGEGLVKQFPFEMIQIDARVSLKYIPFFEKIKTLNDTVENLPVAPHQVNQGDDYIDVDILSIHPPADRAEQVIKILTKNVARVMTAKRCR